MVLLFPVQQIFSHFFSRSLSVSWYEIRKKSGVVDLLHPLSTWSFLNIYIGNVRENEELPNNLSIYNHINLTSPTDFFLLLQQIPLSIMVWNSRKNWGSSTSTHSWWMKPLREDMVKHTTIFNSRSYTTQKYSSKS